MVNFLLGINLRLSPRRHLRLEGGFRKVVRSCIAMLDDLEKYSQVGIVLNCSKQLCEIVFFGSATNP